MFSLNEKIVYPGYGVARISRILVKKVGTDNTNFFELTFLSKPVTILVPVANALMVGIRRLGTRESIDSLLKNFSQLVVPPVSHNIDASTVNWNKRNKEYQGKMRTGDLQEICEIYRDLKIIEHTKGLSFGEKTLLTQTEALLIEEIGIVYNIDKTGAMKQLCELTRGLERPCTPSNAVNSVQN
jgi:CarD family transcriptional regulator